MPEQAGPYTSDATATTALARAIERFAQTDGDHTTAIPALTLHRRKKQLRLQEARQFMLNEHFDAGSAAGRVGYESASQFSREYSRLFGAPPQRDVTRMRLAPVARASDLVER
jgi:transcriptional regulator GlxA family with amidase domain